MNILVTGANGQLGNEMQLVAKDAPDKYFFTDVCEGYEHLDITDLEAVRAYVKEHGIGAIVNCAAWTNVDGAEDPEKFALVEKLNATAPENLAKAMAEVGGLLVHISTDYVFGGDPYNTPCREDQQGTPTGVYGLTKLHGEENIKKIFNSDSPFRGQGGFIILRTAWLYSEYGKNFVKTMLQLTATKPQLKVVIDQVGTPTYALDLSRAIAAIIEDYKQSDAPYAKSGIYHYSNEGVCSWFDFTKAIQQIAYLEPNSPFRGQGGLGQGGLGQGGLGQGGLGQGGCASCDIQPCRSSEFPSPVKRPAYSVLDKTKIKETFGLSIPYWTDSLRLCIANLTQISQK